VFRRFPSPWTVEDTTTRCQARAIAAIHHMQVSSAGSESHAMVDPGRRLGAEGQSMSEKIRFQDADGKRVSGRLDVSHGIITVTAHDGRTKMAEIEESMLSPKTLARMLLLQLHEEGRRTG
jgi:hypothetical protein